MVDRTVECIQSSRFPQSGDLRKPAPISSKLKSKKFKHFAPAFQRRDPPDRQSAAIRFYRYFREKNFDYEIELQQVGKL